MLGFCGRGRVRVLRVRWVGCEVAVRRMRWARVGIMVVGVFSCWWWDVVYILRALGFELGSRCRDLGIMVVGVFVDGEVVGGGDVVSRKCALPPCTRRG